MLEQITIVGSGRWATALVKLFSENGIRVFWLLRDREKVDFIQINGYNPHYLSYVMLRKELIFPMIETSMVFRESGLVIFALPSYHLEKSLKKIDQDFLRNKKLAVSIKGFIPNYGCTPSCFLSKYMAIDINSIMVLGGPCIAEEVVQQKSTYMTIGAENQRWVQDVCKSLQNGYIHTVQSNDPSGIEYTSIIKNIIGIATGIAKGLHYGDNFQAVLVSNAMRETGRFLNKVDPRQRDLFQSAYFGDLLMTAYSDYSLNHTLGKLIGEGINVNAALQALELIVEGFYASRELASINKQTGINMPVINAVYRILHQQANPFHEFTLLEEQLN